MITRILAVIGALTVAYHTLGFCLGIIEGFKPGMIIPPGHYPKLRVVWSNDD